MQNLVTLCGGAIRSGAVNSPPREGATALLDARDIADCAAAVLAGPGEHAGKTYHLTGGEALNDRKQVEIVSREVRYVDVPEAAARAAMEKTGLPEIMVDRLMSPSAIVKAGHASRVSEDVALLPGHAPPRFVDFVRRNVTAWR